MKTRITFFLAVMLGLIAASPVFADPATDALSTCLADNTTGKDRKEIVRWMFAGMSAHPEIQDISKVTPTDRDKLSRFMGTIMTKLLAENCSAQTRAAFAKEGVKAMETAFGFLGELAMQELMSNPSVEAAMSDFSKYVDEKKLNAVLSSSKK